MTVDTTKYKEYFPELPISLSEDEYLLKISNRVGANYPIGYLTKLNKNGTIPVPFTKWCSYGKQDLPMYIIEQTFKPGWKVEDFRAGESNQWIGVIHPDGFKLEIYLTDFIRIVKNYNIEQGTIIGSFIWKNHKLVSEFPKRSSLLM